MGNPCYISSYSYARSTNLMSCSSNVCKLLRRIISLALALDSVKIGYDWS